MYLYLCICICICICIWRLTHSRIDASPHELVWSNLVLACYQSVHCALLQKKYLFLAILYFCISVFVGNFLFLSKCDCFPASDIDIKVAFKTKKNHILAFDILEGSSWTFFQLEISTSSSRKIRILMKGSRPFWVNMCHGFGRASRSETEPWKWSDMIRYDKIWQDMIRHDKIR